LVGEVDESATGSASFLVRDGPGSEVARLDAPMEFPPRPPAFSPGFQSFVWGLVLGGYVCIGLLAIGTGAGSAVLFGLVVGVLVFFFVRLFGEDQLRR
jgi:hypothetical protein